MTSREPCGQKKRLARDDVVKELVAAAASGSNHMDSRAGGRRGPVNQAIKESPPTSWFNVAGICATMIST